MKNNIFIKPVMVFLIPILLIGSRAIAQSPNIEQIVKNVNTRNEGEHLIQNFDMTLINKRGKTQTRNTVLYRKDYSDQRKSITVFTSPSIVKGTGFMSYDYHVSTKDDDQWLYLPALKKTKRISASNRGDYFLGTDFTYEDIKLGSKISESDYNYKSIKTETINGHKCYLIEGIPINDKVRKELGYSKVQYWVDAKIWMVRQAKYWDEAANLLKTTIIGKTEQIDGIWSIKDIKAINHKTGHKTEIVFSNIDYKTLVNDNLFTEASLMRGVIN